MKNTLHIVSLPRRGGLEVMFLNFLKAMKEMDENLFKHQIIFSLNATNDVTQEMKELGLTIYNIQGNQTSKIKVVNELLKCVKTEEIAIVYGQNFICNILASIVGIIKQDIKVITHEHGTIWKENNKLNWFLNQFWIAASDIIICNSQATKVYISKRYKVQGNKLKVILNGVPYSKDIFKSERTIQNERLIFVGRLWEIKSVDVIIEAVKYVKNEYNNIELDILGDGPKRSELEKLATELGLEDNVHFHGYVDNVDDFLSRATLMIVPSIRESLGNVVIEAAFQSVPSIASKVDGLAEVIDDFETGRLIVPTEPAVGRELPRFVVDVDNKTLTTPKKIKPNELAKVIIDCLDNPKSTREMGKKAKRIVINKFSMERYVNQISELIK